MKSGVFAKHNKLSLESIIEDVAEIEPIGDNAVPLTIDTAPDNELFKQLGTIATESFTIGNFARYFTRKSESLSIAVQEGFKYLTTFNYDPMDALHPAEMSNFVSTLDFMDLEDLKVAQPNSLKGDLLSYTALLVVHANTMQKVLDDVIKPATSRFGHYLSLPMDRAERKDFEFGIIIESDRDQLVKEEAKHFGSNRSSSVRLGDLFNSFDDFVTAERNMQTVKSIIGINSTNQVKEAVNALTVTASTLIRRLGEDANNKPSNEFVRMISEQLTEVARWVEWYSAKMTKIIETNNTLAAVEKTLLKQS